MADQLRLWPGAEVASESPRLERVQHELADAVAVERNNEEKIEFSGQIVDRANGGDDDARSVAVGHFQNRQPEIHVLVVAPGDDFVLAEPKNRPDADLFTDDVASLDLDMEDFRRGRCIEAGKGDGLVAENQEQLHPQRMMREYAEEDIDDAKLPAAQRRPVGVTEIRAFD